MSEQIKNYLGMAVIGFLAISAVAVLMFQNSYSRSIEPSSFRSFSVSGEGKVVAVPDVAEFTMSVVSEGGKNLATIQKENTEKANRAIGLIKAAGVSDKDLATSNYSVEPRYQYSNCGNYDYGGKICPPPEIVGYTVRQSVTVKVRDFSKTGEIISGVVASGVNSVSGLSFKVDDEDKMKNEARSEAIGKAREKAKAIAKAGNFKVGKLLSVVEDSGYNPIPYKYGIGGSIETASYEAPSIEPGSQEIRANVTLVYEIE